MQGALNRDRHPESRRDTRSVDIPDIPPPPPPMSAIDLSDVKPKRPEEVVAYEPDDDPSLRIARDAELKDPDLRADTDETSSDTVAEQPYKYVNSKNGRAYGVQLPLSDRTDGPRLRGSMNTNQQYTVRTPDGRREMFVDTNGDVVSDDFFPNNPQPATVSDERLRPERDWTLAPPDTDGFDKDTYSVRQAGKNGTRSLRLDRMGNIVEDVFEADTDEIAAGAATDKRLARSRAARIAAINKAKQRTVEGKGEVVSEEANTAPLMPPPVPPVPEMPPLPSREQDSAELPTEPMAAPERPPVPPSSFEIPPAPEALPVQPAEGMPERGLGERLAAKADSASSRLYSWIDRGVKAIAQVSAPMQQAYERWQKGALPKTQSEVAAELREIRRSPEGKGLIGTGLAVLTVVGLAIGVERSQPETVAPTLPDSSLQDNTPQQAPEFVPVANPVQREVRPAEMGEPSAAFARPEQVIKSGEGAWHVLQQQRPEASEDQIRSTLAAYELLDRGFKEDYRVAVNWKPDGSLQFTDLLTGSDVTASIRDYTYKLEPTVASAGLETSERTAAADLDALLDDLFPETVEQVRDQRIDVAPVSAEAPTQKVEAPSQMESLGSSGLNNLLDTMFPVDDVAADSVPDEPEADLL